MKKAFCDNCKKETTVKEKPMDYQFVTKGTNGIEICVSLNFHSLWDVLGEYKPVDLCDDCRWLIINKVLKDEKERK